MWISTGWTGCFLWPWTLLQLTLSVTLPSSASGFPGKQGKEQRRVLQSTSELSLGKGKPQRPCDLHVPKALPASLPTRLCHPRPFHREPVPCGAPADGLVFHGSLAAGRPHHLPRVQPTRSQCGGPWPSSALPGAERHSETGLSRPPSPAPFRKTRPRSGPLTPPCSRAPWPSGSRCRGAAEFGQPGGGRAGERATPCPRRCTSTPWSTSPRRCRRSWT